MTEKELIDTIKDYFIHQGFKKGITTAINAMYRHADNLEKQKRFDELMTIEMFLANFRETFEEFYNGK